MFQVIIRKLLLSIAFFSMCNSAFAEEFVINNLKYTVIGNISDRRCAVTGVTDAYITSTTIPKTVTAPGGESYVVSEIRDEAFLGCTSLTSIEIPNSVTVIGEKAFYNCTSLTSIDIPNSVTSIGASAFAYCTSLTSIVIPNSVTGIEIWAFENCSSLTSIVIPNSVTKIEDWAFKNCSSLTSIDIPNSVTSIGGFAFQGCSSLTSIEIPNSVTTIYDYAFQGCTSLTSIEIPNSVTVIGRKTFYNCTSLTSIDIPNSVTAIWDETFAYCTSLTSIDIPNSVTTIYDYAFQGCTSLTSIDIPNSVTAIGRFAFQGCSSLTSIEIPNSVTTIGSQAFENCISLFSVGFQNSVAEIGENVFANCDFIRLLKLPGDVTGFNDTVFKDLYNLAAVVCSDAELAGNSSEMFTEKTYKTAVLCINESAVESAKDALPWRLFRNIRVMNPENPLLILDREELTLKINESIKIRSLIVPEESDTESATIVWTSSNEDIAKVDESGNVTGISPGAATVTASLPNGTTAECKITVESAILFDDYSLSFKILDNSTDCAITGYSGILPSKLEIPETILEKYNVTLIGESAFYNSSLTSVDIPNSVTSIGSFAFKCSSLSSVNIPASVSIIGTEAFSNCKNLKSVIIPESVTILGKDAFNSCVLLTKFRIEDSNSEINIYDRALFGSPIEYLYIGRNWVYKNEKESVINSAISTGINIVELGKSVTEIPEYGFSGCNKLTTILCRPENPPTASRAFSEYHYKSTTVRVQEDYINSYREAPVWKEFFDITRILDIKDITLSPTEKTIDMGQTVQLEAQIKPSNASIKFLSWSSSDETIATVDENGLVTAINVGEATISATTHNGLSASCIVHGVILPESISIKCPNEYYYSYFKGYVVPIVLGKTEQMNVTVLPGTCTNKKVSWSSSRESVATVDENGLITPHTTGLSTITATTCNGLKAERRVQVIRLEYETSIEIIENNTSDFKLPNIDTYNLNTMCVVQDDESKKLFRIDSPGSSTLAITGKEEGKGTFKIIYTYGKDGKTADIFTDDITVVVKANPSAIEDIEAETTINAYSKNSEIIIEAPDNMEVEVFSLTGVQVANTREHTIRGLQHGTYIVRVGNKSFKVAL